MLWWLTHTVQCILAQVESFFGIFTHKLPKTTASRVVYKHVFAFPSHTQRITNPAKYTFDVVISWWFRTIGYKKEDKQSVIEVSVCAGERVKTPFEFEHSCASLPKGKHVEKHFFGLFELKYVFLNWTKNIIVRFFNICHFVECTHTHTHTH
jgi:hypothetical protein